MRWLGFRVRRCDNCGKLNPPIFDNNPRLCGACATPGGFYRAGHTVGGVHYGANGKVNYWKLQIPFRISWRGWWKL